MIDPTPKPYSNTSAYGIQFPPSTTETKKIKMLACDVLEPLKDLKHSYPDHGSIAEELEVAKKKKKEEKLRRLIREERRQYRSELEQLKDCVNVVFGWAEEVERDLDEKKDEENANSGGV
jgi:hypothetical protein